MRRVTAMANPFVDGSLSGMALSFLFTDFPWRPQQVARTISILQMSNSILKFGEHPER